MRAFRHLMEARSRRLAALVAVLAFAIAASGFEISSHEHRQGCGEDRPGDERAPHVHAWRSCSTCLLAHQSLRSPEPVAETMKPEPLEERRSVAVAPAVVVAPSPHRTPRAPPASHRV